MQVPVRGPLHLLSSLPEHPLAPAPILRSPLTCHHDSVTLTTWQTTLSVAQPLPCSAFLHTSWHTLRVCLHLFIALLPPHKRGLYWGWNFGSLLYPWVLYCAWHRQEEPDKFLLRKWLSEGMNGRMLRLLLCFLVLSGSRVLGPGWTPTWCFFQASSLALDFSCEMLKNHEGCSLHPVLGSMKTPPQNPNGWMQVGEQEQAGPSFCCGWLLYLSGSVLFSKSQQ